MFTPQHADANFLTKESIQQFGSAFWIGLERIRNQRDQPLDITSAKANIYSSVGSLIVGPVTLDVEPDATQPILQQAGYLLQTGPDLPIPVPDIYRAVYELTLRTGEVFILQQSFVMRVNPFGGLVVMGQCNDSMITFMRLDCSAPPPDPVPGTFFDTFLGADETDLTAHTLDTGQAWVYATAENTAGFKHLGLDGLGHAHPLLAGSIGLNNEIIVNVFSSGDVQTVEIDFTPDMSVSAYMVIYARESNDSMNIENASCGYNTSAKRWSLFGNAADAGINIAQVLATGVIYRCKLEVTATDVNFYVNDVLLGTRGGAHYPATAGGYVGFSFAEATTSGIGRVTNFNATVT